MKIRGDKGELTDSGTADDVGCAPGGVIAAAPHVLTIGVDRFSNDAVVTHDRNAVVLIVLGEVEGRRADDALPEVSQPKVEVLAGIQVMMLVPRLLVVEAGLVRGRSPPHPTEAALRDAPGPAQHLYAPSQGLQGQTGLSWRRRSRPRRTFQISTSVGRDVPPFRFRVAAQVIRLAGVQALVRAVVGNAV